jgi:uroporphyrinogen decarboxylase
VPLIGFSGAPFTLATYLVEGGTSRNFRHVLSWMYQDPQGFMRLLDLLTQTVILYLRAQVEAGVQAIQIFDTWAGLLSRRFYREFAFPGTARIVQALKGLNVPVILYVNGCAPFLEEMAASGVDVLSVDWRVSLSEAAGRTLGAVSLQGNVDPMALFAPQSVLEREVARVLGEAPERGHIFNLGHGIQPETPIESAQALVECVHRLGRKEP